MEPPQLFRLRLGTFYPRPVIILDSEQIVNRDEKRPSTEQVSDIIARELTQTHKIVLASNNVKIAQRIINQPPI